MKLKLIAIAGVISFSACADAGAEQDYVEQCKSEMYASLVSQPSDQVVGQRNSLVDHASITSDKAETSTQTSLNKQVYKVDNLSAANHPEATYKPDPQLWCENRTEDERALVDNEHRFYGFMLKKGTLVENVEALIDEFYPNNQGLVSKVGRHVVPADMCILKSNKKAVIQKIVEAYEVDRRAVAYGQFANDIHVLFYEGDAEFHRYFAGVGK